MEISGLLFPDVKQAVAWGRMVCPLWLADGAPVWPFIRVAARGMVTCTGLFCHQGLVPQHFVIHYLARSTAIPSPEYSIIKFHNHPRAILDVPSHLSDFDYISIPVHKRFKDFRGKLKPRMPSLFDDM